MYERDIQQQEEGKGLNRGTPEHLAISNVSISMVTHYFDESFLRTEEDYVNTYSKSHLSDSVVEDTIFSPWFIATCSNPLSYRPHPVSTGSVPGSTLKKKGTFPLPRHFGLKRCESAFLFITIRRVRSEV